MSETIIKKRGRLHQHGRYEYYIDEEGNCSVCRGDMDITGRIKVMWRPKNYWKLRGGPKFEDCSECSLYKHAVDELEHAEWKIEVDARLVNHKKRHVLWAAQPEVKDSEYWFPVEFCQLCEDVDGLYRSVRFWKYIIEDMGEQIERHYVLHKGYKGRYKTVAEPVAVKLTFWQEIKSKFRKWRSAADE